MDASLLVFGASAHWNRPDETAQMSHYQAWNPGLGIALRNEENAAVLSFGVMRNSLNRVAVFGAVGGEGYITKQVGWTASLMAATGYLPVDYAPLGIPVVGLYYEVGKNRVYTVCMPQAAALFLEHRW